MKSKETAIRSILRVVRSKPAEWVRQLDAYLQENGDGALLPWLDVEPDPDI